MIQDLKIGKQLTKGSVKVCTPPTNLCIPQLDGVYVCEVCSTPVATTDDKISVEGQTIRVRRLIDESNVAIQDATVRCGVCDTELGQVHEANEINLNGATLALDAGELHYIYPDSENK